MERLRIHIVGQSGMGIMSTGNIFARALKKMGFFIVTDREYPSLIQGGHSLFALNISTPPIRGLSRESDIMLAIDKQSLLPFFDRLKKGGVLVHAYDRVAGIAPVLEKARRRKIEVVSLKGRELAESLGGNSFVVNVVLLGMLWKVMGLPYRFIEAEVKREYADHPKILEIDLKCLKAAYEQVKSCHSLKAPRTRPRTIMLNGNHALALGAVHAGVRAYYAYPMSPSSSILTHMSKMAVQTGMVVKQAEDEITVAQMALGSMHMGTRALCATSGGGFDLMTETLSLAGIIETPFVAVIAQRPGPATGLPTWTAQGDLNLAMYAGHGEFPRVVLSLADPEDSFYLIQEALNLAEEFQVPVLVLTDKDNAESALTVSPFKLKKIAIGRGLVSGAALKKLKNTDRYELTASGLSKRWIPGSSDSYYFANSDEHQEDGGLTEEAEMSREMMAKRMRKMALIKKKLPEPKMYGVKIGADISFVGWGSTKKIMLDMIEFFGRRGVKVNFLHFNYVYPLKLKKLREFFQKNKNVHLLEVNYLGQLGELIEKAGFSFKGKFLKYDGRPFFVEDVERYVEKGIASKAGRVRIQGRKDTCLPAGKE